MAEATAGRRLEFERVVAATLISDVAISPDGRQVAFVTRPESKVGRHPVSDLWLVADDGGPPRRLTDGRAAVRTSSWSPDGRYLAFTSDRGTRGVAQIHVIAVAGGKSVRVTAAPAGVEAVAWSPDGNKLAYTARDPEPATERERRRRRDDARVIDADQRRCALWVMALPPEIDDLRIDPLSKAWRVSPLDLHIGSYTDAGFAWRSDSRGFIALTSDSPRLEEVMSPEMVLLGLDGETHSLGCYPELLATPALSPDGLTVVFMAGAGSPLALFTLQTIATSGGEAHVVLPDATFTVRACHWLPDGRRLLALVEDGVQSRLLVIDIASGTVADAHAPFPRPGSVSRFGEPLFSVSADGSRVAFARADAGSYGELYLADLGGVPRRLTRLHAWLRRYVFGEVRELAWSSSDGLEIQGLLILPVGYREGRRYPTLVQLHGGPAGAWTHHLNAG